MNACLVKIVLFRNQSKAHVNSNRKGMSLVQVVRQFSNEEHAERMFIQSRWRDGVVCPSCNSDRISEPKNRNPQPFRCKDCRKFFRVKTGTVMHGSNLSLGTWSLAAYILTTNLKRRLAMKLHRDLGVSSKTASPFGGTVEYVNEFAGRNNQRRPDTEDQTSWLVRRMDWKRLRYKDLTSLGCCKRNYSYQTASNGAGAGDCRSKT